MLSDNEAVLVLRPEGKVDYHFAELDANAINFYLPEPYKYFSIASGIFLEGDEKPDQPEFEIGDQQMHRGGLRAVVFSPGVVELGLVRNFVCEARSSRRGIISEPGGQRSSYGAGLVKRSA
jgi:hypothetical protein